LSSQRMLITPMTSTAATAVRQGRRLCIAVCLTTLCVGLRDFRHAVLL
jgi:hypothetical protein